MKRAILILQVLLTALPSAKASEAKIRAYDLVQDPFAWKGKIVRLSVLDWPVIFNNQVVHWSSQANPQMGFAGLRFMKMLREHEALYAVMGMDAESRSGLTEIGAILVVTNGDRPELNSDGWIVKPLGTATGVRNGYGAPVDIPEIQFVKYAPKPEPDRSVYDDRLRLKFPKYIPTSAESRPSLALISRMAGDSIFYYRRVRELYHSLKGSQNDGANTYSLCSLISHEWPRIEAYSTTLSRYEDADNLNRLVEKSDKSFLTLARSNIFDLYTVLKTDKDEGISRNAGNLCDEQVRLHRIRELPEYHPEPGPNLEVQRIMKQRKAELDSQANQINDALRRLLDGYRAKSSASQLRSLKMRYVEENQRFDSIAKEDAKYRDQHLREFLYLMTYDPEYIPISNAADPVGQEYKLLCYGGIRSVKGDSLSDFGFDCNRDSREIMQELESEHVVSPSPSSIEGTAFSAVAADAGPKALLAKTIGALGSHEKVRSVRAVQRRSSFLAKTPQGEMSLEVDAISVFPNQLWRKVQTPMGVMIMVATPWTAFMMAPQGTQEMPDSQKQDLLNELKRDPLFVAQHVDDPKYTFAAAGSAKVGGQEVQILDVNADGAAVRWFIEAETGRILRSSSQSMGVNGPTEQVLDYSDWKDFGGIRLASRAKITRNGQDAGSAQVKAVTINPTIDAKLFQKQ